MDTLIRDLRFAFRTLAQQPGFTAVAVITLALGIGASSAIFSVVDAILLNPLPYEDPEELVMLREAASFPMIPMSAREFLHLREVNEAREPHQILAGIVALDLVDFNVTHGGEVDRWSGAMVSTDFFDLFGVRPVLGRGFAAEEGEPGRNQVALISHSLWRNHFAGDAAALGSEFQVYWNASFGPAREIGRSMTVVGVLPPNFISPMGPRDVWIPLALGEADVAGGAHYLFPFARLAPDVSLETAQAELSEVLRASLTEGDGTPGHEKDVSVTVVSLPERAVGRVRPALLAVSGAVMFVLLIACANVANLLLARASTRKREMAVRMSLGASRVRLLQQFLVESLVLASLGCVLGLGVARAGVAALQFLQPAALPRLREIEVDRGVLLFAIVITLLTALIFGLLPALRASAGREATTLRSSESGAFGSGSRLRRVLVVTEVMLAVVLLAGAGLLLKSFGRLLEVDLGIRGERVLTFGVALPEQKYSDPELRQAFYREALERLEALPEVESVAAINTLPLSFLNTANRFTIEGRAAPSEVLVANTRMVSAGYFETLGIALLRGEGVRLEDVSTHPKVALINRAMARRFWGEDDPVGAWVTMAGSTDALRVAGIVGDVRQRGAAQDPPATIYIPVLGSRVMSLVVRGRGEPQYLAEAARRTIRSLDPEQPIHDVQPMDQLGFARLSRPRFNAFLIGLFAVLALVLSAIGIYGVLSFSVSQREREMGVRLALGARRWDVHRLVVGQGMRLVLVGLGLGLLASFGLTRFLGSLLFGVRATDPATFAAISALLLAVALVAVSVPARRATQVEPMTALRHE